MGMGDVSKGVTPKVALLAKPTKGGAIATRYFVPDACHKALAVTGTVCLASACAVPGTLASRIATGRAGRAPREMIEIEHPSGKIAIDLDADFTNGKQELRRAALIRTARRVFEGRVLVPEKVWAGRGRGARLKARALAAPRTEGNLWFPVNLTAAPRSRSAAYPAKPRPANEQKKPMRGVSLRNLLNSSKKP